ncbi:hypothetical protein Tco_0759472 [Tanacetum coccineum]
MRNDRTKLRSARGTPPREVVSVVTISGLIYLNSYQRSRPLLWRRGGDRETRVDGDGLEGPVANYPWFEHRDHLVTFKVEEVLEIQVLSE